MPKTDNAGPKKKQTKHEKSWTQGLENHKRLIQILPFLKELDEGYL